MVEARARRSAERRPRSATVLPQSPVPPAPHFDGRRFFNPGVETDRSLGDLLRWRQEAQRVAWPAGRENRAYRAPPATVASGTVAVTFVGQATFLLTTASGRILTDPIFSDRASPLGFAGPKRVRAPGLALDALPPIDLVLLSHNHYDHMDLPSLRRLTAGPRRPPILTGLGNAGYLAGKGVPGATELDWWDETTLRPGLRATFVPAQHWSSRTPFDRRRTLWGGFVLEIDGVRLYFCGDSGYCPWFSLIRERCGPPDVALLPIGAYEPRWFMGPQHMNPEEAVRAHREVGAHRSVGMHFGTFQLTDEGIDAPVEALDAARREAGLDADVFTTLDIGETRLFTATAKR